MLFICTGLMKSDLADQDVIIQYLASSQYLSKSDEKKIFEVPDKAFCKAWNGGSNDKLRNEDEL